MTKETKAGERTVKAWMGFTDGKPYLQFNPDRSKDMTEYCVYKTRKAAKADFEDVRVCTITYSLT